jgi:hypothetical protein
MVAAPALERAAAAREISAGRESHWLDENSYPGDFCDGCPFCAPEEYDACPSCGNDQLCSCWWDADGYPLRTRSVGGDTKRFPPRLGDLLKTA